jgi:hypothetical protein
MVAASRKTHTKAKQPAPADRSRESERTTATPDPEGAPVAAEAAAQEPPEPCAANLRALYDHLLPHLGRWRVDAIDGSLIVSPVGSPGHQWVGGILYATLLPVAEERGWRAYPGLDVILPGSRHPYTPDFAMAPKDAPTWGDREVFTDGLIMVGEIVSPGSVVLDREKQPGIYARGGVPILLLVDHLRSPECATVYSEPKDGRYARLTSVELGEKLRIPEPVDFVFDTSVLVAD